MRLAPIRLLAVALLSAPGLRAGPLQQSAPGAGTAAHLPHARALELVGLPVSGFPHFRSVRVVQETQPVWIAIDPTRQADLVGLTGELYVVAARSQAQWRADATLVDLLGGPQPVTVQAGSIQANRLQIDSGTLSGLSGAELGVGYDVVIDYDGDGRLGAGDVIDGAGDTTGFFVVRDATQPGPYATSQGDYSGGSFLGQRTYYPSNIATLGKLPLVVISHGNGHLYTWYDHIGQHLASWGCVVMSHQNNTQPGPESASVTTLGNTEYFLANQATLLGGVLAGHVDNHSICWIGHSRGGEGVVRAYNKIATGTYSPVQFKRRDIRLVSSIAPTQYLFSTSLDPFDVNFHMFVGAADSDVNGGPGSYVTQSLPIFERAAGEKLCTVVQGAGHADFHAQPGNCWCTGPNLIGKAGTHAVEKAYYLALVKRFCGGSEAARDFLERAFDDLALPGIPSNVIAANEYHVARAAPRVVIDDFQSEPSLTVSSSGAAVNFSLLGLSEGLMGDLDSSFEFSAGVPFNGMTRWRDFADDPRCAVFDWDTSLPMSYEFELPPEARDLSGLEWLSFRACQGTRHPSTDAHDAPLSFVVELLDRTGQASAIDFAAYGQLTRPYRRTGAGAGAGWANELVTVRIRLDEFRHDAPGLDLQHAARLRFLFAPGVVAPLGRIGLDDIEFLPRTH